MILINDESFESNNEVKQYQFFSLEQKRDKIKDVRDAYEDNVQLNKYLKNRKKMLEQL